MEHILLVALFEYCIILFKLSITYYLYNNMLVYFFTLTFNQCNISGIFTNMKVINGMIFMDNVCT